MDANRKQHVLHVTHNMAFGGTEQVIKQIISGVDSHRFFSSVICIDGKIGEIGQQMVDQGVEVYSIYRGPGLDKRAIAELRALIKQAHVDIVHCHQYTPFCYGVFAAMLLNVKVLFTEHGRFYPDRFTWKRRLANQLLYRLADRITCISKATRKALDYYEWIPEKKIEVIYNGVSEPHVDKGSSGVRTALEISPGTLVLGTISRLDSIKNQVMMIEALATYLENNKDVALILAGDGPERSRLEARAQALGVSTNVHFTGFITNTGDYLDAIDVFLLTSFSEGTSMTLLEAMALGKVIVATAVGGTVEVIDHGRTGLLIESDDKQGLVDWLVELGADTMMRQSLSSACRIEYTQRFCLETMCTEYEKLYV